MTDCVRRMCCKILFCCLLRNKTKFGSSSVAALLYSVFGVAIEKARGAEDDINTVAAGTLTGMLFKSGSRCLFCYTCHYCTVYPGVIDCNRVLTGVF